MKTCTRKEFIHKSSLGLLSFALADDFRVTKSRKKLAFSSIAMPGWPLIKILDFAKAYRFDGVEFRGLQGEMDLTKCSDFSALKIKETVKIFKERAINIIGLGSSAKMHFNDKSKIENLDEAKRYIELAHQLKCPYIRVFPDKISNKIPKKDVLDIIVQNLAYLAQFSNGAGVSVLLETHGDLLWSDDLLYVMKNSGGKSTGLIWDICNMWSITKEPPSVVYKKIGRYIRHVHIKDAFVIGTGLQYKLLGEGNIPLGEAITSLEQNHYKGFYSFEWEKLWHPELLNAEIALPQYKKTMQKYF